MSEKKENQDDPEEYEAKLARVWKKVGVGGDKKEVSEEPKEKPVIEKVDLEILDKAKNVEIKFEDESEEQMFASKILNMVDLKMKTTEKSGNSEIKEEIKPVKKKAELPKKKTEYIVSPTYAPVLLSSKAYKRMVGYAIRYANQNIDQRKWKEVYGILIGEVQEESKVIVKDAIPMIVGDRAGVQYENKQYVDMAQIDESIYERSVQDRKGDFIIGWWHTHPGFGFFFSEVDCYTQLGYQVPNSFAVGLIFDHCEKRDDFLGVAGLRLLDPDEGILSDYDIVELNYEESKDAINKKVEKLVKKINKEMPTILREVEYIDQVLRTKALAQLQRNFGLMLVPKRDIKVTEDEDEAEEDDSFLYVWDPEFFKKSYRIPKFREKVESSIKKYEEDLKQLKEKDPKKFEEKRKKYTQTIKSMLEKPEEWYARLMEDYRKRLEAIYSLYDYLDTTERKIIENFEQRTTQYRSLLDYLIKKAEFELKE